MGKRRRGSAGDPGNGGKMRRLGSGERTVSSITGKAGTASKRISSTRTAKDHLITATSASFSKHRRRAQKDGSKEASKPKKAPLPPSLIEVVRSMVRPYRVSATRSLRLPKIRTTTTRTRTVFYVENSAFDRRREAHPVDDAISVAVYLDTDDEDKIAKVLERVAVIRELSGYGPKYDVTIRRGSIYHKAKAALTRTVASDEVAVRLTKLERAVELAYLDSRQAEVDGAEATAVQQLIESVQDINRVCMRVGSILLIKYQANGESVILVRNLSQVEMRALERCPEIQTTPEMALSALATAVESMESINAVRLDPGAGPAVTGHAAN